MLKISTRDDPEMAMLKIEGKLTGPWAKELDQAWSSLVSSLTGKKLRLDICGVIFVDKHGKRILRKIFRATEAEILADTPLTKYFADEIRRERSEVDGEEIDHA